MTRYEEKVTRSATGDWWPPIGSPHDPSGAGQHVDVNAIRDRYGLLGIDEGISDPLALFAMWFEEAQEALPQPTAMVLATSAPSMRIMTLKGVVEGGFDFDTHLASQKAEEIAADPRCALLFPWQAIGRQVRLEGVVARLGPAESDFYFERRPRNSKISARATAQSSVIASRSEIVARFAEQAERYPDDVPRPDNWGAYRLRPSKLEFWQARPGLVHDRMVYRRDGDAWTVERITP